MSSHCDQCGEYVEKQGDYWIHAVQGSPYCVLTMTDGVPDSFSAEECQPCTTDGCVSNEEYEARA